MAGLSSVATIAIAELAYVFERNVAQSIFDGFGDALLWSAAAVIALQADPVPSSVGARLAMITAFIIGLVLVASLAGVIGSFFIENRREGQFEET